MEPLQLQSCPRCAQTLLQGFAHRAAGLSFVDTEKLDRLVSIDEDLSGAGLRKFLPSRAEYFRSYLCRSCQLYLVDYSTNYTRAEARELSVEEKVTG